MLQAAAAGYMVAFAGRQYAARSMPILVADNSHTITSFTLVFNPRKTIKSIWPSYILWHKLGREGTIQAEFSFSSGARISKGYAAELVLEEVWVRLVLRRVGLP